MIVLRSNIRLMFYVTGCLTYVCHEEEVAFTGDTLLIRGCGRTDFDQGDPETLYNSIYNQIFSLPNTLRLYPGHDYRGTEYVKLVK